MEFIYKVSSDRVILSLKLFDSCHPHYSQCSGALGCSLLWVNWNLVIECLLLGSLWNSQGPLVWLDLPCWGWWTSHAWVGGPPGSVVMGIFPSIMVFLEKDRCYLHFILMGKASQRKATWWAQGRLLTLKLALFANLLCYTCVLNCWARKRSLICKLFPSWWPVEIFPERPTKERRVACGPCFYGNPQANRRLACLGRAVLVWLVFSSLSVEERSWCVLVNTLSWDLGFPLPLLLMLFALAVGQLLASMPQKHLSTQGHGGAGEAILRCMFRFNEGIWITLHKICAPELYDCTPRPPPKTQPPHK